MDGIEQKRLESLLAAERQTLEMIAGGAELTDILADLCSTIDAQSPEIISAVLLMDPDGSGLLPAARVAGPPQLHRCHCPGDDRPLHRFMRHRRIPEKASNSVRHRQRSLVGLLSRRCIESRPARRLVAAPSFEKSGSSWHLLHVLCATPKPQRE